MQSVIGLWLLALLALAPAACDTVPDYPNRPLATGAANPPPADLIGADPGAPLILIAFSGGGSRVTQVLQPACSGLIARRWGTARRNTRTPSTQSPGLR